MEPSLSTFQLMRFPSLILFVGVLASSLSLHICTRKIDRSFPGLSSNDEKAKSFHSSNGFATFLAKCILVDTKHTHKLHTSTLQNNDISVSINTPLSKSHNTRDIVLGQVCLVCN